MAVSDQRTFLGKCGHNQYEELRKISFDLHLYWCNPDLWYQLDKDRKLALGLSLKYAFKSDSRVKVVIRMLSTPGGATPARAESVLAMIV